MTIAFVCDGPQCGRQLGRDAGRLELNEVAAVVPVPVEEDEQAFIVPEFRIGADACDRHFCSLDCLAAWSTSELIDRGGGDTAP